MNNELRANEDPERLDQLYINNMLGENGHRLLTKMVGHDK